MKQFQPRKPTRLSCYDYSKNGMYFITICAKDKQCLFGTVRTPKAEADQPQMQLSDIGEIVNKQIKQQATFYAHISIEKYIIMPNHVHLLLCITSSENSVSTPNRMNAEIPKFIATLKRFTNKQAGMDLWQRSYHDHIVRNEQDFLRIWQYIDSNAAKWQFDCFYRT